MTKTILITGSTDGIGLETARALARSGHRVLLHGRNADKLAAVEAELSGTGGSGRVETLRADLSRLAEVDALARDVASRHTHLDALINNAGVYRTARPETADGLDARFAVNTIAPYRLTLRLLPLLDPTSRVINLSSAAQAPVDLEALASPPRLAEGQAYAQSKLALTAWSRSLATSISKAGPAIIAVNPGSLLATNMVRQTFGIAGNDIRIGAEILVRAALSDAFADASGKYFDNDSGQFAPPHADARDAETGEAIIAAIEAVLARTLPPTG